MIPGGFEPIYNKASAIRPVEHRDIRVDEAHEIVKCTVLSSSVSTQQMTIMRRISMRTPLRQHVVQGHAINYRIGGQLSKDHLSVCNFRPLPVHGLLKCLFATSS